MEDQSEASTGPWQQLQLLGQLGQSLAVGKWRTIESRGLEMAGDPEETQQKEEARYNRRPVGDMAAGFVGISGEREEQSYSSVTGSRQQVGGKGESHMRAKW